MPILETLLSDFAHSIAASPLAFYLLSIILVAIFGDPIFIILMVLAVNLKISFLPIFAVSYIGALLGDIFWFFTARKLFKRIEKYRIFGKPYRHLLMAVNKVAHRNDFVTLFVSKFLYGTRIISVIYLSEKKLSFLRFAAYALIANLAWLFFIGAIGYLVGIGFSFVANVVKNIQLAITLLIIFFVIFVIVRKKINEKFEEVESKK